MNHRAYINLLGEKAALERMLDKTPEDDVLDRMSLSDRIAVLDELIASTPHGGREPARVSLTFRGAPVVGSHGIFAEFGIEAVGNFVETVTAMAASLDGPLAAMGPIRDRERHKLLITDTAVGSFGFELEEHLTGQLSLEETSPVGRAIEKTYRLLLAASGDDDEALADSASEVDRRAMVAARSFLQTLVNHDAVCAVQIGTSTVAFDRVDQIARSLTRLSSNNIREHSEDIHGAFQGALPDARTFEFRTQGKDEPVIRGKIGPGVDIDEINQNLRRPCLASMLITQVGTGRPRYVVVATPHWLTGSFSKG